MNNRSENIVVCVLFFLGMVSFSCGVAIHGAEVPVFSNNPEGGGRESLALIKNT